MNLLTVELISYEIYTSNNKTNIHQIIDSLSYSDILADYMKADIFILMASGA